MYMVRSAANLVRMSLHCSDYTSYIVKDPYQIFFLYCASCTFGVKNNMHIYIDI